MRYDCRILLCSIVVFVAEINVVTSIQYINNNVRTVPDAVAMTTLHGTSTRLLRPNSMKTGDAGKESEERVGLGGISSKVEDLMNKLFKGTSSTDKAVIQMLLNSKVHPIELFRTIRPNLGIAKLNDNPELLQWFRLAIAYRKRNGGQALPDLEIYFMLLRQHQARDVESLIQKLKNTAGLKKLGISMENSLSGSWINKALKRQTDPEALFNRLRLKEAGAKLDETPVFHQWLQYVDSYRTIKGYAWFGDLDMLSLFRQTMPEGNVVALLHMLRQTPRMTKHADTMQKVLFEQSKSSHQLMLNVWLKAQEPPEKVYQILHLQKIDMDGFGDNAIIIQWLRYTKLYRDKTPDHPFSDIQTLRFLQKERSQDWKYASLFQVLKETPDLKKQAENMQTYLFRQWVKEGENPMIVAEMLTSPQPFNSVLLPKSDIRYLAWEAFTLYFAKHKGGEAMLKKVQASFASNNPRGALAATTKSN